MKQRILQLVFALCFVVGIFCPSVASASEIQVDTDDFDVSCIFDYSSQEIPSGRKAAYDSMLRSDLRALSSVVGSGYDDAIQIIQPYATNITYLPLSDVLFGSYNYGNAFSVSIQNFDLGIDYTLPNLEGYYTVAFDVYVGVCVNYPRNRSNTLVNTFTTDKAPDSWTDQDGHFFQILFVDDEPSVTATISNYSQVSENFIHLRCFYIGVDSGETISLHLHDYFSDHISSWSAAGVFGNGYQNTSYALQSFFVPEVSYLPEPPATPTPIPTPYPGQDTQESINQGVQIIVDVLDVSATPIPTPADITLDPDDLESLEALTLPDVSSGTSTYEDLWKIFAPAVPYLTMLIVSLFGIMVFLWILEGRWF